MKTPIKQLLSSGGRPGALFSALTWCLFGASVAAQPSISWNRLDLDVDDIRSSQDGAHELVVYYPNAVDADSLGGDDLWVVSPNGYNEEAALIDQRRVGGFFGSWIEAVYAISAPEWGWSEAVNGRYTVLLQPDAVRWKTGQGLDAALLGAFEVFISRARPLGAQIEIEDEEGRYVAAVTLVFPHPGFEVAWGDVSAGRRAFYVDPEIVAPPEDIAFPAVIDEQTHRYEIPVTQPGRHDFEVRHAGETLASERFHARGGPPVPAEVELEVALAETGHGEALARIHFLDPFYVLVDPGIPEWDPQTHTFTIEARAETAVFVRPPDEPAITEVAYPIQVPEPGRHWIEFKLNGAAMARQPLEWYPAEPFPMPLDASVAAHEVDGSWVVDVSVEVPEGAMITHWGDYTRRGPHFTANVLLEWIPIDPLQLPAPPQAPEHRYELGPLEPGEYSFRLFSRESEIEGIEFDVDDRELFEAELLVGPVLQAGATAQEMTVVYRSEDPFDLTSFGDGDLVVKSWARFVDVFPLPIWASQSARLMDVAPDADATRVEVVYEIDAPEGGWTAEHNGDFEVCLAQGEVWTLSGMGRMVEERSLGSFDVAIDSGRLPAQVELEVNERDGSLGADVRVEFHDFPYHSVVDWGEVVEVAPDHYVADATTAEVAFIQPPEEPLVETHRYAIPPVFAGEEIPFEILEFDEITAHKREATFIARDLEGWLAVLGIPPELAPLVLVMVPVEFNERSVLAVFGGEKPMGGFTMNIDRVLHRGDHLLVEYTEGLPGPVGPDVLTYPQQLVSIPATDLPVRWSKSVIAYPGPPPVVIQEEDGMGSGGQALMPPGDILEAVLEFRMNGVTYAETVFSRGDEPFDSIPEPESSHFAARLDADGQLWMDVTLDYGARARGLRVVDWGAVVEGRGRRLYADVVMESQPPSIALDAPEGIFEHSYPLGERRPGSHHFELLVNGDAVGSLWFLRKGWGAFGDWLASAWAQVESHGRDRGEPGDIDGDGASDYAEWVLGSDGADPEDDGGLKATIGAGFEVSHHRRVDAGEGRAHVEVSFDLVHWQDAHALCDEVRTREVAGGMIEVTYCLPTDANPGRPVFVRVRVEEPEGED